MGSSIVVPFVLLTVAGAVVAVTVRALLPRVLAWRGVWFTWRTRFGPALVFDSADDDGTTVRLLNVNGTFQSVCYVDDELLWDPVCEYHRSWARVVQRTWPLCDWSPGDGVVRRCLVMGGGGYSFPKWLVAYRPDIACVAVEIDPAILGIARERLFVDKLEKDFDVRRTGRLELPVADAWAHVAGDEKGYDLIVNDAFRGNRPLGPLQTDEGARMVRAHLRAGGVYIGNVRSALEGRKARPLDNAREAFLRVFDHVEIIPERPEEPRRMGNNALVAWNDGTKGKERACWT